MIRTLLVSAAAALTAGSAAAQVDYTAMMQTQMDNMSYTAMTNVGVASMCGHPGVCDEGDRAPSSPATGMQAMDWLQASEAARSENLSPADFSYRRDPAVTASVEADILQDARERDPQAARELEAAFRRTDIVEEFDRGMREFDLSGNDLADAFTAYWVLNWMVVNGIPSGEEARSPSHDEVRAVRDQLALAMTRNPGVQSMDAAQRQEMTESLIYNFMILDGAHMQASRPGNEAAFRELSDVWRLHGQRILGVDLRELELTARGFERRG